ncbi:lysophospholipase [Ahniella affigens]|uniref:Lysophospholipase n=1 Tax=Ahniella affigens TaxID=2021234 RepID=A0A2P1PWA2_9GAMM|nr:SGNH/GDSL hydrolase family protein [Ahniella affigens]AVP99127.1 lysophospholipase [Ahniella affigens]
MSLVFESTAGAAAPRRFLALGDSYTIGEGVSVAARWPNQLIAALDAGGTQFAEPTVIARTGWTTDELDAAIDDALAQGTISPPYDLVSLLIGVNNQYRGRPVSDYEREFAALLQRALHFAGKQPQRVFVMSIPDWGVTAFGAADPRGTRQIGDEIDAFNEAARAVATRLQVAYIDITPISRQNPTWLVADQLHPDQRQYQAWADAALAHLRR